MVLKKINKSGLGPGLVRQLEGGFIKASLISLSCVAVLVAFWMLSKLGPQTIDYETVDTSQYQVTDAMRDLQGKSLAFEGNFDEILSLRKPNAEDVAILKQALDLQEAYIKALPTYDVEGELRLNSLRERYAEHASLPILEKSRVLEAEADALSAAKDYLTAHERMKGAFELQKQINEQYPQSPHVNHGRATLLQRKSRYLIAEPIYQESLDLEAEADELGSRRGNLEQGDWNSDGDQSLLSWNEARKHLAFGIAKDKITRDSIGPEQFGNYCAGREGRCLEGAR